ncbi:lysylphosphatidylglycerol synthase domain-containing protein [Desulfogranum marinum]|uniref:lysylphosphatidylglycerol synthase domain-containing protein n=1 Tax=Desulfogranum marinum TaxID=453220 RepID=UPI0019641167|nr:flippase-like domain-containing protein [Desulfogranum marinum]
MITLRGDYYKYFYRVALSMGVSAVLLAILIQGSLSSISLSFLPKLLAVIAAVPFSCVALYIAASIFRTSLRAYRYRVIVAASETHVPSFFHFFLVTASRNMFVDMLPARLGELSYVAMLNRGYAVAAPTCFSSLIISFVFDLIALTLLIVCLILVQMLGTGNFLWLVPILCLLCAVLICFYMFFLPALRLITDRLGQYVFFKKGIGQKCNLFAKKIVVALEEAKKAAIGWRLLILSIGIRVGKYVALYALFVGVAVSFPMVQNDPAAAVIALISAEAGASLPLPVFMGFGAYEAGGTLAMVALGATKSVSLVMMLALHIVSQIVDYIFGGIALVVFFLTATSIAVADSVLENRFFKRAALVAAIVLATGLLLLVPQLRKVKKLGAIRPPDTGQIVERENDEPVAEVLDRTHGFIVWSSNRNGNHDIYKYSFQDKQIIQLTSHAHTEYFPRISPGGEKIVFARSNVPWVSQRNHYAWDVYVLNLVDGVESLLARNGTFPTWSQDGQAVYFLREGYKVVELDIASGHETVVLQTGENSVLPETVRLETPSVKPHDELVALTLRGSERAVVTMGPDGKLTKLGQGCQLSWSPTGDYLYKIDHGGKQQNAIFFIDSVTLDIKKWFDSPSSYSHEYFPKVSNDGDVLVFGASKGGHEHDSADYEIFLWVIGTPWESVQRITHHTGNDCWPDVYIAQ